MLDAVNPPIPMHLWSRDHWSTLVYVASVVTECTAFQVGADPRMKTNRRHFRLLATTCASPLRPLEVGVQHSALFMKPDQSTKLRDGTRVAEHDDWSCLLDMASEGLFDLAAGDVRPGSMLHLSARGKQLVQELLLHKAAGGRCDAFVPSMLCMEAA